MRLFVVAVTAIASVAAAAPQWDYKAEMLPYLVTEVPTILADQETTSGHFGEPPWIVTDQNVLLPLAAAWALKHPNNPHYHSPALLQAIIAGGDALIRDADKKGQWVFRKKDGSKWGKIYMPWTYSRWMRAYGLIKDAMPPEKRAAWDKALRLGYENIARHELGHIHNIPVHHAMGLYVAGQVFDRNDWMTTAAAFLRKTATLQHPDGYWSENQGPVVGYNLVYMDALGVYYALSKDPAVLPALRRGAVFHSNFTYPNGSNVETIDERQVYHSSIGLPNVGFTHTPEGRGLIQRQWQFLKNRKRPVSAESAAVYLLYGGEGEVAPAPVAGATHTFVTSDQKALVHREGRWFMCMSGYTSPVPAARWIQDRQNLVSLYHSATGLILGGGNTKLQPLWSTFTVGDPALLKHTAGDEKPNFLPPAGIVHVPSGSVLTTSPLRLALDYAGTSCSVAAELGDSDSAKLVYALDSHPASRVEGHLPLMPAVGKEWSTASGKRGKLGAEPFTLDASDAGGWFQHDGWRVHLPANGSVTWPVLPHNPYRKDGRATPAEGKIVVTLPLSAVAPKAEVRIEAGVK